MPEPTRYCQDGSITTFPYRAGSRSGPDRSCSSRNVLGNVASGCSAFSCSARSSSAAIGTPVTAAKSHGRGMSSIRMDPIRRLLQGAGNLIPTYGCKRGAGRKIPAVAQRRSDRGHSLADPTKSIDDRGPGALAWGFVVIWAGRLAGHVKQAAKRSGSAPVPGRGDFCCWGQGTWARAGADAPRRCMAATRLHNSVRPRRLCS